VKDLLTFLTSKATSKCYCEVFRKTIFKTVSSSGTNISQSAQLHKESISKATAAASAQVSKFRFHRAILRIKLSHHVYTYFQFIVFPSSCYTQMHCKCLYLASTIKNSDNEVILSQKMNNLSIPFLTFGIAHSPYTGKCTFGNTI
jgi:hypothetical protein